MPFVTASRTEYFLLGEFPALSAAARGRFQDLTRSFNIPTMLPRLHLRLVEQQRQWRRDERKNYSM